MVNKLIIFDLDGTLAESKAAIDADMAQLLKHLLRVSKVAIISGGDWPQFEKQVLSKLPKDSNFKNLDILPTCGTKYYSYKSGWNLLYAENFTETEKSKIVEELNKAVVKSGLKVEKLYGQQIEDRGSQVTFSALGQQAPLAKKKGYDPKFLKRKKIKTLLDKTLPNLSIKMGGETSIDITKLGIDKAYGIHKLQKTTGIMLNKCIFIGDALFKGGNDYPARSTGVACIQVNGPAETKKIIEAIVACLTMEQNRKHGSV